MDIVPVHNVPQPLRHELDRETPKDPLIPGFIMGLHPVLSQDEKLRESVSAHAPAGGPEGTPLLYVPASQTPWIFEHERELDVLKTIVGMVAGHVHPYGKAVVNGSWLMYGAAKLRHEWSQPNCDTAAWLIKIGGLGLGALKLPGDISMDWKLPDFWGNGFNVLVKSGDAYYHGKTPSPIEQAAWLNPNLALPAKLHKILDAAIQGNSGHPTLNVVTASWPPHRGQR